jgi:ribonucleoside-diphosphate reductase alpha chain
MAYLLGSLSLDVTIPAGGAGAGQKLSDFLRSKGLPESTITSIEGGLPGVFELSFAFASWALPADAIKACGIDPAKASADSSFNLLKTLGLTSAQCDALNLIICGTSTVEGAPHLKDEHLPVFDCANKCGKLGKRYIAAEGHIRMMAAAQPFISGAISKTINLPNEASVQDIKDCYRLSWELGLKANALYRDGCKLSQPLSATADEAKKEAGKEDEAKPEAKVEAKAVPTPAVVEAKPAAVPAVATDAHRAKRRRLPDTRRSMTHKFNVAGHEGYLTVGLFEDGKPGELFITMSKEGSTIGGLMDSLGTAISVSLQYGVPVESLVTKFSHQRFEPAGMTENRDIPFAKSLVDYIFRWMGMQFIPGYREANAPNRGDAPAVAPVTINPAPGRMTEAKAKSSLNVGTLPIELSGGTGAHIHMTERTIDIDVSPKNASSVLSEVLADAQSDAPACDVCGNVTVRSGTCYKCLNCGNSMGCS